MQNKYLKNSRSLFNLLFLTLLLASCDQNAENTDSGDKIVSAKRQQLGAPNILLLIGDDMGQESIGCYDIGTQQAHTPTLNNLCNQGVRFDNFWTQPVCSPTRATILTGNYGFRNGVQIALFPNVPLELDYAEVSEDSNFERVLVDIPKMVDKISEEVRRSTPGLAADEFTLAKALKQHSAGYATGAFGKWHLADWQNGGINHPEIAGFDHFSGAIDGTLVSYFDWHHVENGVESHESGYFTSRLVDDALDWIHAQQGPWFAWMGFTAPHDPFHKPPLNLLISEESKALHPGEFTAEQTLPYFHAQLESMDTEIKRLIAGIPEQELQNTYIIFLGDNGPMKEVVTEPYGIEHVKGSLYQGAINMPFFVYGPGINAGVAEQISNSTDLYATLLELAGINLEQVERQGTAVDSISLLPYLQDPSIEPRRDYIYADVLDFSGIFSFQLDSESDVEFAIRERQYKYIYTNSDEMLFDLIEDPFEKNNLLDAELTAEMQLKLEQLKAESSRLQNSN